MLPLYLDILLKIKIAELFGKVSVIEKNGIDTISFKNIHIYTKNHHNNLIGKVECNDYNNNNFMFYYIPLKCIENYEVKNSGIEIYSQLSVCPFCFGIHLDIEEQYNYYKMMKNKEMIYFLGDGIDIISDELYKLLKEHFCFELIKKNSSNYEAYLLKEEYKKIVKKQR
jgi:hypothetical protein